MYHEFLVNQKIKENTTVEVNFIDHKYLNWSYETFLGPIGNTNTPIFPIVVSNEILIQEKPKGRETKCTKLMNGDIHFTDDYSVPGGFLICVTSPSGYKPSILKLKSTSTYRGNDYNNTIPAYFEVKSNKATNVTSVLMHVLERSYFGVSIDFVKFDGSVKDYNDYWFDNPYDLTLSLNDKKFEIIEATDMKILHPKAKDELILKLTEVINELIIGLGQENEPISNDAKIKLFNLVPTLIAGSSSVVTLLDSYRNSGVIGELMTILVKLFG